jgi:hypothetical protein
VHLITRTEVGCQSLRRGPQTDKSRSLPQANYTMIDICQLNNQLFFVRKILHITQQKKKKQKYVSSKRNKINNP